MAVHTPKERVGLSPAARCCCHNHTHTSGCASFSFTPTRTSLLSAKKSCCAKSFVCKIVRLQTEPFAKTKNKKQLEEVLRCIRAYHQSGLQPLGCTAFLAPCQVYDPEPVFHLADDGTGLHSSLLAADQSHPRAHAKPVHNQAWDREGLHHL